MNDTMGSRPLTLGVILYPGFELLDVFGPLEMFASVGRERLVPIMVAERAGPVPAGTVADGAVGPRVLADYGFDDAPALDLLLIPGGIGTFPELANEKLMAFLRDRSSRAQITASVCTGSALLAKSGVLDGHRATSNKQVFSLATAQSSKVDVDRSRALGRRWRRRHVVRAYRPAWTWRSRSSRGCSVTKLPKRSPWVPNTRGIAIPRSTRSSHT